MQLDLLTISIVRYNAPSRIVVVETDALADATGLVLISHLSTNRIPRKPDGKPETDPTEWGIMPVDALEARGGTLKLSGRSTLSVLVPWDMGMLGARPLEYLAIADTRLDQSRDGLAYVVEDWKPSEDGWEEPRDA